jgi:NAD(P)H-flavin reductase
MIDERNRSRFGNITVIYGARNPGLLTYKDELEAWAKRDDIDLNVTVDKGDSGWKGRVLPDGLQGGRPELRKLDDGDLRPTVTAVWPSILAVYLNLE